MPSNATPHAPPPPPPNPQSITKAAQPTKIFFDPYNSSATGHQRAENRLSGSTSWRDSRTLKLAAQYRGGQTGGERLYDTVGAGSEDFGRDGRKENGGWERGASGLRGKGQRSIAEALGARTAKSGGCVAGADGVKSIALGDEESASMQCGGVDAVPALLPASATTIACTAAPAAKPKIFAGLCVYINGSTAPLISDHRLKYILAEHGARLSIALGRRTVTHVILGSACTQSGAGGGLSGSKIQKEIARVRGKGVKFVGVEWVVESVRAGKRLSEARFAAMKLGGKGQGSVYGMFKSEEGGSGGIEDDKGKG